MSLADYFVGNAMMYVAANGIIVITYIEGAAVEARKLLWRWLPFIVVFIIFVPAHDLFLFIFILNAFRINRRLIASGESRGLFCGQCDYGLRRKRDYVRRSQRDYCRH